MKRLIRLFLKDERGFAALLFAIMMPILIALAGLLIDGGLVMYSKAKLEAASEAAALSTIAAYDEEIWEDYGVVVIDEYTATLYAQYYLALNLPEAYIVFCEVDFINPSKVTLITEIPVEMVFAKAFGINERKIRTQVISHGK